MKNVIKISVLAFIIGAYSCTENGNPKPVKNDNSVSTVTGTATSCTLPTCTPTGTAIIKDTIPVIHDSIKYPEVAKVLFGTWVSIKDYETIGVYDTVTFTRNLTVKNYIKSKNEQWRYSFVPDTLCFYRAPNFKVKFDCYVFKIESIKEIIIYNFQVGIELRVINKTFIKIK